MSVTGVSFFMAFAGGVASFVSPCVLPLVPAYLSVIGCLDAARRSGKADSEQTGSHATDADALGPRLRCEHPRSLGSVTGNTFLFIFGFTCVFVLLGLSASALGRSVVHNQGVLTRISGVVVVAMAMLLLGSITLRNPGFYREYRIHPRLVKLGRFAAPVAGAAFAFGWTPCVGPILASVLALSTQQGQVSSGALLLIAYSFGLGIPFLAAAFFLDKLVTPLALLRRHGMAVTAISATTLALMGILLTLDRLAWVTTFIQRAL